MGIRGRLAVGVAALAALAFAAPASAETFVFADVSGDELNGLQLGTPGPSGCPAPYCPVANDDFAAAGKIVGDGPYPDCGAIYHYHGTLFGKPDPAPDGCGWGPVYPITDLQSEAATLSSAITLETDALISKDPHHAKHATGAALSDLKSLKEHPENLSDAQKQDLKFAIDQDQIAKRFFDQADEKDNDHVKRDLKTARKHIEEGLDLKRSLFDEIVFG